MPLDLLCGVLRPRDDRPNGDSVRGMGPPWGDPVGGPAQQSGRAGGVASLRVGDADGKLCESTPKITLGRWRRFPRTLKHLVRAKGTALIKQDLCLGERLGRWQGRLIRSGIVTSGTARQRSAVLVTRASVAGPSSGIPITIVDHRLPSYEGDSSAEKRATNGRR